MLQSNFAGLIDDRPDDNVFRVHRRIYTDQDVFAAEMERIFEQSWTYVCHESQIAKPGDYYATKLGREPVLINRRDDGSVGGLLNACAHRGALLNPTQRGNARILVCRYHGWSFSGSDGRCLKIKEPAGEDPACYALRRVPRVESYKGFVFATLNEQAPPLAEHLGASATIIDMLADQSSQGMEVLPGVSSYIVDGNWKLQAENGVDAYHVTTVHRNFANTVKRRDQLLGNKGMKATDVGRFSGELKNGTYDLGHGHNLIWTMRGDPSAAPLWEAKDEIEPKVGPVKWDWMCGRGRNLFMFPNLFLMDQSSTQIRVLIPISPSRTEIKVYCLARRGESRAARVARMSKFRDFFLGAGLATTDDSAALEDTQTGAHASAEPWNVFQRGWDSHMEGPDEEAKALGLNPVASNTRWDPETHYVGQYRRWRELMSDG
jgi:benzoate/toluate 1,2-dioxygenase subunit alpha